MLGRQGLHGGRETCLLLRDLLVGLLTRRIQAERLLQGLTLRRADHAAWVQHGCKLRGLVRWRHLSCRRQHLRLLLQVWLHGWLLRSAVLHTWCNGLHG